MSRQSLVTPIDWKCDGGHGDRGGTVLGRQSLVTPIDWKPGGLSPQPKDMLMGSPIFGDAY